MRHKIDRRSFDVDLPVGTWERIRPQLMHVLRGLRKPGGFGTEYLEREIFSKYSDPKTVSPKVRREAAKMKWLSQEHRNAKTNQRLYLNDADFGYVTSEDLLSKVRTLISRILGPVRYPAVLQLSTHTNGASTRVSRSPSSAVEKLTGEGHISSSAYQHWVAATLCSQLAHQKFGMREASEFFTVPKKTEIDRVACKEPEGNMLLQRSAGLYIRDRLRRFGIDLQDQSVNQDLARRGSEDGSLATIDLSSASDSITRQLVMNLLPFEWWSLLDDLRVKSTIIDGARHELEMFSSMGNGFTFELESLIFYAVTRTVCRLSKVRGRISVYGDDIICPSGIVPRLIRVFHWLGFRTNSAKTFHTGPFRESCGKHYYRGFDVSPFYIRREIRALPDLINFLNNFAHWNNTQCAGYHGELYFLTSEALEFWKRWAALVPRVLRGGQSLSDPSALVDGSKPKHRLIPVLKDSKFPQESGLVLWLHRREYTELPLSIDSTMAVAWKTAPIVMVEAPFYRGTTPSCLDDVGT